MKVIEYQTDEERARALAKECPKGTTPYIIEDFQYPDKKVVTIRRLPYYDENDDFLVDEWLGMKVRPMRNELLQEADTMMLADRYNAMTDAERKEWTVYRKELRDLPGKIKEMKPTGPVEVEWPTRPV